MDLEIDLAIHHLQVTTSLLGILLLITVFFIFPRPPNGVWVDLWCSWMWFGETAEMNAGQWRCSWSVWFWVMVAMRKAMLVLVRGFKSTMMEMDSRFDIDSVAVVCGVNEWWWVLIVEGDGDCCQVWKNRFPLPRSLRSSYYFGKVKGKGNGKERERRKMSYPDFNSFVQQMFKSIYYISWNWYVSYLLGCHVWSVKRGIQNVILNLNEFTVSEEIAIVWIFLRVMLVRIFILQLSDNVDVAL